MNHTFRRTTRCPVPTVTLHTVLRPTASILAAAAAVLFTSLGSLPASAQSLDAARAAARKALQGNPEVTSRLHAYQGKVEAQTAAAAGWKPRVDLNADAGVDRAQYRDLTRQNVKSAGLGLSVTQVLWDGMATRDNVARAGHERLSRWFDLVDVSEQTALEATRAVYDVQRQRKLLALAEDNFVQHQQAANKLEQRVKAGVGRGVDLDQARARLALAEANRDTELSNLHDVAARYQRIVGESPSTDMGAVELLKTGLPSSAEETVQLALARSAAIASGIEGVRAARANVSRAKSALQPQVSARAQVGGGRNLNGVNGLKSDASVGLQLNWNLYNGGADGATVREQQQAMQQAMDLRDKACRDARQTALVAFNDANKLTTQLNTLGRNSASIERARDAYRQQFDIGQRSLLDLLNAENEAYTARRTLTNAVYDRAVAYARTLASVSQLNSQLGLARDLVPADGANWTAAGDPAGRCPAVAVDVTALRAGVDTSLPGMPLTTTISTAQTAVPTVGAAGAAPYPAMASMLPAAAMMPTPMSQAANRNPVQRGMAERISTERDALEQSAERTTVPINSANTVASRVQDWAVAWRKRDAARLAALYAPAYKGGAASPAAFAKQQRSQLAGNGELDMEVEDVTVKDVGNGLLETRFLQSMTTANGIEVNQMAQTWQQVGGQWRIVRERKV